MHYTYAYKTSDGVRHEAVMNAPSREAVFETLRKQGIRAIKVVAADGSKANGEIRGVRKRVVVLSALCLVLGAVVASVLAFRAGESAQVTMHHAPGTMHQSPGTMHQAPGTMHQAPGTMHQAPDTLTSPRHQIYGDPVVVEAFEGGDFFGVLTNKADQMLAWFAQPGKLMCPKGTDPRRMADAFAEALTPHQAPIPPHQAPSTNPQAPTPPHQAPRTKHQAPIPNLRELCELKQIVNGMHEELAAYLANGNGTPRSYWRRLIERTQQEMQIYERTRRELENEKNEAVWDEKNAALRRLGLRTIPNRKESELVP